MSALKKTIAKVDREFIRMVDPGALKENPGSFISKMDRKFMNVVDPDAVKVDQPKPPPPAMPDEMMVRLQKRLEGERKYARELPRQGTVLGDYSNANRQRLGG